MAVNRLHVLYSGRVQGVGFRYTAETVATSLELTGWVKNIRDGRVEVVCEGEEASLKEFLEEMRSEMELYVWEEDISWIEPTGEFKDFQILFG